MSKLPLKFWWLFFCEVVWRLIAWAVVPFTMLFLKKADMSEIQDKIPYKIGTDIQRYVFPKWAECVEMIDDVNIPFYEPSIQKMHKRFGHMFTTWVNLSFRNCGMSLTAQLAQPVSNYWYAISDQEKAEKGLFDNHYRFGNIVLKVGWISYRDWKGKFGETGFFSIPRVTLRYEKRLKMKYKYKLKQDSYYTSNGCDCCEADRNEIWEITRIHSDGGEAQLNTNGTPRSLEDCYEAILIDAGIGLEIEWEEDYE